MTPSHSSSTTSSYSSSSSNNNNNNNNNNGGAYFEIYVSKDTFKFNASHFVAYPGFRERLHGHNYRASVRLVGGMHDGKIGGDGYVLDFGCVKEAVKGVCKGMNEHFIVPMLSDVLDIEVEEEDEEDDDEEDEERKGEMVVVEEEEGGEAGESNDEEEGSRAKRRKRGRPTTKTITTKTITTTTKTTGKGGSVTIVCEDGTKFVFPRRDCLLLPLMHTTAEELAIYLYGKILSRLNAGYLVERGVSIMEVTVSEMPGQEAVFRRAIPRGEGKEEEEEEDPFDVAAYVRGGSIPVMPCATDTENGARRRGIIDE